LNLSVPEPFADGSHVGIDDSGTVGKVFICVSVFVSLFAAVSEAQFAKSSLDTWVRT
jgi:hypothetical protein